MAGPSEAEQRRMLEDAGPLFAATCTRYRALVPALESWGWRARLRSLSAVAREVVRTEALVEQSLRRATRRASVEQWPAGKVRQLLDDVALWRRRLAEVVERRLPRASPQGEGLSALLALVVGLPRAVPLAEREAAGQEALEGDGELIASLQRFGTAVAKVFGRPLRRGRRLPFTLEEYDALLADWPRGTAALTLAWARVARIDTSGGVERELTRRAKRAPKGTRGPAGPLALVHATFWVAAATTHQQTILAERFSPLQLTAFEQRPALRFLLARELDGAARLEGQGARGALLMLAHELSAAPEGRAALVGGRVQVSAWAAQADALEGDDDWRRFRDGLRALGARSVGRSLPPLYRVGRTASHAPLPERLADFFSVSRGE